MNVHCSICVLFSLQRRVHTAELKILIVFAYFLIFFILVNCRDALHIAENASFRDTVGRYFLCEAVGYTPGRCNREELEQFVYPLLNITFYIMAFLLPVVNLMFVINCRILKEQVKELSLLRSLKSQPSSKANE